jgi:hypothetical protein
MNKEFLHMQKLAGIITESEYKAKLNEAYFAWEDNDTDELKRAKRDLNMWANDYALTVFDGNELYYGDLSIIAKKHAKALVDKNDSLAQETKQELDQFFKDWTNELSGYRQLESLKELIDTYINEYVKAYSTKESLNENFVGIPAINNIFEREKTDYEIAFEHFTKGTSLNEEMDSDMGKEKLVEKIKNLGDFGFTGDKIEFKGLLITCSTQEDENETPHYFVYGEDEDEDEIFSSTNPNEVADFVFNLDENTKPGTAKERSAMDKKARAGKDIGEKGKNFEKIAKEVEEELEEGILGNILDKINQSTGAIADVLTIIDLARKDEEGGADKAVQMIMDRHGVSQEEALKVVTNVYNKFAPWIERTRK